MYGLVLWFVLLFFFKQKTAYEMRISDWSSDVCSSDLNAAHMAQSGHRLNPPEKSCRSALRDRLCRTPETRAGAAGNIPRSAAANSARWPAHIQKIGRASWRERVCQYV